jgi:hypothetical protein
LGRESWVGCNGNRISKSLETCDGSAGLLRQPLLSLTHTHTHTLSLSLSLPLSLTHPLKNQEIQCQALGHIVFRGYAAGLFLLNVTTVFGIPNIMQKVILYSVCI